MHESMGVFVTVAYTFLSYNLHHLVYTTDPKP